MPSITGLHHISFTVRDLGTSVAWYQDVLGFEHDTDVEREEFRRTRLRHPGAGVTVTLTAHRSAPDDAFSELRAGLDHLAFSVGGVDEIEAWKQRFEERGVDHSEIKRTPIGAAIITLRDPDNIQLEVFAAPSG